MSMDAGTCRKNGPPKKQSAAKKCHVFQVMDPGLILRLIVKVRIVPKQNAANVQAVEHWHGSGLADNSAEGCFALQMPSDSVSPR